VTRQIQLLVRTTALVLACAFSSLAGPAAAQDLRLPLKPGSVRFAVLGDTGSGHPQQYEVGRQMARFRARFPFEFVILLGDNMYGADTPDDYRRKFEEPYAELLKAGVKFYAALGNHDNPNQRFYAPFNMKGDRYYSFKPKDGVRFFVLDTNYLDREQVSWLDRELRRSSSKWKLCYFHHPLYSSARAHGPSLGTRAVLEPVLMRGGVSVVFAGHEHVYERMRPQRGILHFTSGGGGQLRPGDLRGGSGVTAVGYDQDFHFMLVEIADDDLYFQAIDRTGRTVDEGRFSRPQGR
jgi:hypothetical protein